MPVPLGMSSPRQDVGVGTSPDYFVRCLGPSSEKRGLQVFYCPIVGEPFQTLFSIQEGSMVPFSLSSSAGSVSSLVCGMHAKPRLLPTLPQGFLILAPYFQL